MLVVNADAAANVVYRDTIAGFHVPGQQVFCLILGVWLNASYQTVL